MAYDCTSGSCVARYYDPRTSVWQSPDPAFTAYLDGDHRAGVYDSLHMALYTYVVNNPLKYMDPNGLAELIFVYSAHPDDLSNYSVGVINDIVDNAGMDKAYITTTKRTPQQQAATMYKNLEKKNTGKNLYKSAGQKVEGTYRALKKEGESKKNILSGMVEKINELGPEKISAHMGDFDAREVVDIADNLIPKDKKQGFSDSVNADKRVDKYLAPSGDPAHHIEIPQPKEVAE